MCRHKNDSKLYACKIIKKQLLIKHSQLDHVKNELYIHSNLKHNNIAEFIGYAHDNE